MSSRPSSFPLTSDGNLRLYSIKELLEMPPPVWMIDSLIPQSALVAVYGESETFKSFWAIDLAMSVGAGVPFMGKPTQKGFVVYVAAEGGGGLAKRVLAWLVAHDLDPKDVDISFVLESVSVGSNTPDVERLKHRLDNELRRKPTLIVFDTLARCFEGDENQQEDMGTFINGIDTLRKEYGCTNMVVHHTGVNTSRARGSTALRSGVETMICIERQEDVLSITCDKQKDAEHFETAYMRRVIIEGANSCVLEMAEAPASAAPMLIETLRRVGPCSWNAWKEASGLNDSKFMKAFGPAKKLAKLKKNSDDLWCVADPI